ncbi:RES family NAD+ phosphorylase [Arthrobacter echini]|nr:RES family NAD+ phosphorylase [Arthrobacter echini]
MTPYIDKPTKPLTGFPSITVPPDLPLYRATSTDHSPWWFGSTGTQRFDLEPPDGTCYLAVDIETAVRERGRERLLNSGMMTTTQIAEMNVYELRLPTQVRVADTTDPKAVQFGANRELTTTEDYAVSCAWAQAFHVEGYRGMVYTSRFTSGTEWTSLAVFNRTGDARWPICGQLSGVDALLQSGLGYMIERPPRAAQADIVPPPPPLPKT